MQEADEAWDVMDVPHKVRTAIILLRWLCESHTWEKTVLNDCVLSKLLLGDGARAHIDGIYIPVFCVWRMQMKFTLKHIRDMADIMHLARAYLSTLMADDVTDGWASVVLFLSDHNGLSMLAAGESYSKDDPALGGEGGSSSPWRARLKTLLRYQKDFLGTQGDVSHIISTIVNYVQELRL